MSFRSILKLSITLVIFILLATLALAQDDITFGGTVFLGNTTSDPTVVDTNATTACGTDEFLDGNGNCVSYDGWQNGTLIFCGNITGATSDLCTIVGGSISNASIAATFLNLSGTNADQNVNINPFNFSARGLNITNASGTIGIFINENGFVGIGIEDPSHNLDVHGHMEVEHTADEDGDHGVEIDIETQAFGDVKALFIDFDTGAIIAEQDESIVFINVDQFAALGGAITGFVMVATEGSATLTGLQVGVQIAPILQLSGIFGNMDSINISNGTNGLAAFTSQTTNITIFDVDDYTVTIGNDVTFQEIEVILEVEAGGGGIKPVFYHSTGVDTWGEFTPSDGTSGFRDTGVIVWEDSDVPDWEVGFGSEFLIRINRTANNIPTAPIELLLQISDTQEYFWDRNGSLFVNEINATSIIANTSADIGDISLSGNLIASPGLTINSTSTAGIIVGGPDSNDRFQVLDDTSIPILDMDSVNMVLSIREELRLVDYSSGTIKARWEIVSDNVKIRTTGSNFTFEIPVATDFFMWQTATNDLMTLSGDGNLNISTGNITFTNNTQHLCGNEACTQSIKFNSTGIYLQA